MRNLRITLAAGVCMSCLFIASRTGVAAEADSDIQGRLRKLQEQNELLQRQLGKQNDLIENLSRKVSALENSTSAPTPAMSAVERSPAPAEPSGAFQLGKVSLSGEGGLAFFRSGSKGTFPN